MDEGKAEMERFLMERRRSQKTSLQRILRVKTIFHIMLKYCSSPMTTFAGLQRQCALQVEDPTPPDEGRSPLWDQAARGRRGGRRQGERRSREAQKQRPVDEPHPQGVVNRAS